MKQNNPFMAHHSSAESDNQIPSQPLHLNNNPHLSKHAINMKQQQAGPFLLRNLSHDDDKDLPHNPSASQTHLSNKEEIILQELVSVPVAGENVVAEDSGRERLKRHRVEVAGRVWIPEIWGQEELLKDWIDCTAFDAPLVPGRITTAREALVEEGRRVNAAGLGIENRC